MKLSMTMLTFRRLRWVVVAAGTAALLACSDHRITVPAPRVEQTQGGVLVESPLLKLDIVFMVDNSGSMADKQENLVRNFPRFMHVLESAVPAGTLDAHIAVVSSDLGVASPGIEARGCGTTGGDNGAFQFKPRGACAGPRGSYLITNAAGRNFDGDIADVFSCIARLGTGGCGFEHQLASLRRALGGDPAAPQPAENAGFLRPDARLGLVLITDEDDCSAPAGSDLFTPDPAFADAYGPLESYRCNQFGHLCDGAPPPRGAASGLTCHSNEGPTGRLIRVGEFVDFFRGLKRGPDLLRVAAITGPATPYATHVQASAQGDVTVVSPSCASGGGAGDASPAVRLGDFVDAFGANGLFETICTGDLGPAMEHIAQGLLVDSDLCVSRRLYDVEPGTPGLQADCTVERTSFTAEGAPVDSALPACGTAPAGAPCWRLTVDPRCAGTPEGLGISVEPGASAPSSGTRTRWSCRGCPAGDASPGCRP